MSDINSPSCPIPLGDRVTVRVQKAEEVTPGGLVIPQNAQDKPLVGEVLAVGKGAFYNVSDGKPTYPDPIRQFALPELHVGSLVAFGQYAGVSVKHNREEFLILHVNDLLAIVG